MTDRDGLAVERVEAAADIAIGSAEIALKAAKATPVPAPADPRDDVNYQRLVGLERSMLARVSPRRNRWNHVAAVDARIDDLDRRQTELHGQLADPHQRRARLPTLTTPRTSGCLDGRPAGCTTAESSFAQ